MNYKKAYFLSWINEQIASILQGMICTCNLKKTKCFFTRNILGKFKSRERTFYYIIISLIRLLILRDKMETYSKKTFWNVLFLHVKNKMSSKMQRLFCIMNQWTISDYTVRNDLDMKSERNNRFFIQSNI